MSTICCDFKVTPISISAHSNKAISKIYTYIFVFNILHIELWVRFFKVFIVIVDRIGGGRDSEFMFLVDILTVI